MCFAVFKVKITNRGQWGVIKIKVKTWVCVDIIRNLSKICFYGNSFDNQTDIFLILFKLLMLFYCITD